MAAPMELQQEMLREIERLEHAIARLRGLVMQSMIEAREVPTASAVRGAPCAAEFCYTQPAEEVNSSAMIPPRELDRITRGGE